MAYLPHVVALITEYGIGLVPSGQYQNQYQSPEPMMTYHHLHPWYLSQAIFTKKLQLKFKRLKSQPHLQGDVLIDSMPLKWGMNRGCMKSNN